MRRWTDDQLIEAVRTSKSKAEVLRKLGLCKSAGNRKNIEKHIARLGLPTEQFSTVSNAIRAVPKTLEDVLALLIENSAMERKDLKKYLLRFNLIEYKCRDCGLSGFWNGKKLTLQIEHINGVNNDHRLSNLCWLCPNCHSQTDTFSGRNNGLGLQIIKEKTERRTDIKRKVEYPERRRINYDEVVAMLQEKKNYRTVGKMFGISDSMVRKIYRKMTGKVVRIVEIRGRAKVKCPHCGKVFDVPHYRANRARKNGTAIFCSLQCSGSFSRKRQIDPSYGDPELQENFLGVSENTVVLKAV